MTGASRSAGTKRNPCAQWVRFTEMENDRLHEAIDYRGVTVQAFGRAAIMRAVIEVEAEMKAAAEAEKAKPQASLRRRPRITLADKLDNYRVPVEPLSETAPQPTIVIQNIPPSPTASEPVKPGSTLDGVLARIHGRRR